MTAAFVTYTSAGLIFILFAGILFGLNRLS